MSSKSANIQESEKVASGEQNTTNKSNTNINSESKNTKKSESESLILTKFSLYETKTRFYIIGTNQNEEKYRILKIDRTVTDELIITDDDVIYSKQEITQLLAMIEDGNKVAGGLRKIARNFFGIIGFIKFLEGYYMIIITKTSTVAVLGGHYIYHIDDTVPITIPGQGVKIDKKQNEARYSQMFSKVDLTKNCYFSYTYDITRSLQHNLSRKPGRQNFLQNDMFIWNHYLLKNGFKSFKSSWVLPIIHGFVDQSKISIYGHIVIVTLIARRSRHFAGARFLKRGVNNEGYVANDVETEQIVHDAKTTSFYLPPGRYGNKPAFTSFLQHRGSIPLYWSQDTSSMAPKPPIHINVVDPYYSAAALHFDNMFKRYGFPIIVLNLVKTTEKTKRESVLSDEFFQAVTYLNQTLPQSKHIIYIAWDMSRASKSEDQDLTHVLEDIAEYVINTTGFFHSGAEPTINAIRKAGLNAPINTIKPSLIKRQTGIVRINCVDCLDRTNGAQSVIGKCALAHQLYALGILSHPSLAFDTDAFNLLNAMYHDHGDTIALQYGGSHLVNTMETYRKIAPWTSHSRDMIESIKRYYSNSFTDADKQNAINLFLGNYIPSDDQIPLWELTTDHHFHNKMNQIMKPLRSYTHWWKDTTFEFADNDIEFSQNNICSYFNDNFFEEYYRPKIYIPFDHLFSYAMISTLPMNKGNDDSNNSPFSIKSNSSQRPKYFMIYSLNIGGVKRWLTLSNDENVDNHKGGFSDDKNKNKAKNESKEEKAETDDKENTAWWMTNVLANQLLSPEVPSSEIKDYKKYVNQYKSDIPLYSQYNTSRPERHPEYKYFQMYIRRGDCSYQSIPHSISKKDEKIYKAYNKIPTKLTGSSSKVPGMQGDELHSKRYIGYSRWITTGKYSSSIPGVTKSSSSNSSYSSKKLESSSKASRMSKHYKSSTSNKLSGNTSLKKLQRSSSA